MSSLELTKGEVVNEDEPHKEYAISKTEFSQKRYEIPEVSPQTIDSQMTDLLVQKAMLKAAKKGRKPRMQLDVSCDLLQKNVEDQQDLHSKEDPDSQEFVASSVADVSPVPREPLLDSKETVAQTLTELDRQVVPEKASVSSSSSESELEKVLPSEHSVPQIVEKQKRPRKQKVVVPEQKIAEAPRFRTVFVDEAAFQVPILQAPVVPQPSASSLFRKPPAQVFQIPNFAVL